MCFFFFFQAEDGIRDGHVTGVQTCALPISLAKVRTGDVIRLDADAGTLEAKVDALTWAEREREPIDPIQADDNAHGLGRELFAGFRRNVNGAEQGACS